MAPPAGPRPGDPGGPRWGKILNVASASADKLRQNQELSDLMLALGCGSGSRYDGGALRYDRVVIMTDADVDGAHRLAADDILLSGDAEAGGGRPSVPGHAAALPADPRLEVRLRPG